MRSECISLGKLPNGGVTVSYGGRCGLRVPPGGRVSIKTGIKLKMPPGTIGVFDMHHALQRAGFRLTMVDINDHTSDSNSTHVSKDASDVRGQIVIEVENYNAGDPGVIADTTDLGVLYFVPIVKVELDVV